MQRCNQCQRHQEAWTALMETLRRLAGEAEDLVLHADRTNREYRVGYAHAVQSALTAARTVRPVPFIPDPVVSPNVQAVVFRLLEDYDPERDLGPQTTLAALGMDSLDILQLAMACEQELALPDGAVPDAELLQWRTVQDVLTSYSRFA